MKQINPDVMGAYPITPSTEIPQYFSTYVDNGEVDTLFIAVESEHSAMSTCIGAEAAGCRAISATSSCGLCYMTEMLYVAASDRLPITLAVSCRALSGPININNDHSDAMGVRDAGWLMLFAETNQEAYDNYLQAMRIAEAVSLPIMVCQDGFITSHAIENIELVETEKVKEFVGEYKPAHALLKPGEPMAVGAYATPVYYMEAKRQQAQAMMDAKDVIRKVGKEFGEMTGRTYGLIETYMMDDAEEASVISGSLGMLPSASVGSEVALFEPIHGSYPQAAGKNIANPMATILSAAMLLEHLGLDTEGSAVRAAVDRALTEGVVTEDLAAQGERRYSTSEVGDFIAAHI